MPFVWRLSITGPAPIPALATRTGGGIKIPTQQLDLWVQPQLANQEMHTTRTAGTPYWEGTVAISGTAGQETLTGVGYVELTGYAGRLRLY